MDRQTGKATARVMLLLAVLVGAIAFLAPASASASSSQKAIQLQRKIDGYLAEHPDWRQISTDTIVIPGGKLTVAAPGVQRAVPVPSCSYLHLCINDGYGHYYDYYECGYFFFPGVGDGTFNNNQSRNTLARFYNSDAASAGAAGRRKPAPRPGPRCFTSGPANPDQGAVTTTTLDPIIRPGVVVVTAPGQMTRAAVAAAVAA